MNSMKDWLYPFIGILLTSTLLIYSNCGTTEIDVPGTQNPPPAGGGGFNPGDLDPPPPPPPPQPQSAKPAIAFQVMNSRTGEVKTAQSDQNGGVLSAMVGDTIFYSWNTANAVTISSTFTVSPNDGCTNGPSTQTWIENMKTSDVAGGAIQDCQAGRLYELSIKVSNSAGQDVGAVISVQISGSPSGGGNGKICGFSMGTKGYQIAERAGFSSGSHPNSGDCSGPSWGWDQWNFYHNNPTVLPGGSTVSPEACSIQRDSNDKVILSLTQWCTNLSNCSATSIKCN